MNYFYILDDILLIHILSYRVLNNNLLEGQVPEELYSIGVHGGAIEYVNFYFVSHFFIMTSNLSKI